MGLDNIPNNYACVSEKTAVYVNENLIDCKATQSANGCPWKRESAKRGVEPLVTLGMLGTECWYRGKYANALIEDLSSVIGELPPHSLYGREFDDKTEGLDSDECEDLSEWMEEFSDEFKHASYGFFKNEDERIHAVNSWDYIAWWLRYSARFSDGIKSWY